MPTFPSLPVVALAAAACCTAASAYAQDFPPAKPVTMVVGFAPGGAADAAARLIARKLGDNIGQTVIVENKAGAGGNIAHQLVASGPADGSVLLFGSIGPLTIAPHVMKVTYDPFKDLTAVSGGVNFPNVLVVHKELGVKNLAEFVALAKKKPSSVEFASTGQGQPRIWPANCSTSAPESRWCTCPTRAARQPCRTCWADALRRTFRRHPPPCRISKPAG